MKSVMKLGEDQRFTLQAFKKYIEKKSPNSFLINRITQFLSQDEKQQKEAIEDLSAKVKSTHASDPDVVFLLGFAMLRLLDKSHRKEALNLLTKIESKSDFAQIELADMYLSGLGVPIDNLRALNLLRGVAKKGYAQAQYLLARLLENGAQGVAINKAEARDWYESARRQGHVKALCNLGILYGVGHETLEADKALAINLLMKAMDQAQKEGYEEVSNKARAKLARLYDNDLKHWLGQLSKSSERKKKELEELGIAGFIKEVKEFCSGVADCLNSLSTLAPDLEKEYQEKLTNLLLKCVTMLGADDDKIKLIETCIAIPSINTQSKIVVLLSFELAKLKETQDVVKSIPHFEKALAGGHEDAKAIALKLARYLKIKEHLEELQLLLKDFAIVKFDKDKDQISSLIASIVKVFEQKETLINKLNALEYSGKDYLELRDQKPWVEAFQRIISNQSIGDQAAIVLEPILQKNKYREWAYLHCLLGHYFRDGKEGVNPDPVKAHKCYSLATILGCEEASRSLASLPMLHFKDREVKAHEDQTAALRQIGELLTRQTQGFVSLGKNQESIHTFYAQYAKYTEDQKNRYEQLTREIREQLVGDQKTQQEQFAKELKDKGELVSADLQKQFEGYSAAFKKVETNIQSLTRALEELKRKSEAQAIQESDIKTLLAEQAALKAKQEELLDEYRQTMEARIKALAEKKERDEQLELLRKIPSVFQFYSNLKIRLQILMHGYKSLDSKLMTRSDDTISDDGAKAIEIGGELAPIPYAKLIAKGISFFLRKREDISTQDKASKIVKFSFDYDKLDQLFDETAMLLALRYQPQIQHTTKKGNVTLSDCAAKCIMAHFGKATERELDDITALKLAQSLRALETSFTNFWEKIKIETDINTGFFSDWTYEGVFQRPGRAVQALNSQEIEYYVEPNSRPEKYGFMFCERSEISPDARQVQAPKESIPSGEFLLPQFKMKNRMKDQGLSIAMAAAISASKPVPGDSKSQDSSRAQLEHGGSFVIPGSSGAIFHKS